MTNLGSYTNRILLVCRDKSRSDTKVFSTLFFDQGISGYRGGTELSGEDTGSKSIVVGGG